MAILERPRLAELLKMLVPEIKVAEFATNGVKHTALADAVAQAKQTCAILNKLGYKE